MTDSAETSPAQVLITGAAGWIGHYLAEGLGNDHRQLRLLDIAPIDPAGLPDHAELITADVADPDVLLAASRGVQAIVHLGGLPKEAGFDDLVRVNIGGTHHVLEAARRNGVSRVVIASSNHAVGFHHGGPGQALPDDLPGRPDTYYGWSKVAMESLADLYADRFDMSIISVRIGQFAERCSADQRGLALWLSPRDTVALFDAALTAPVTGHHRVWGVSANSRSWFSDAGGQAIGYRAADNADVFLDEIMAQRGEEIPAGTIDGLIGGHFCTAPLGVAMPPPPRRGASDRRS